MAEFIAYLTRNSIEHEGWISNKYKCALAFSTETYLINSEVAAQVSPESLLESSHLNFSLQRRALALASELGDSIATY